MNPRYIHHLESIEQASLPADASDMRQLETILSDAFDHNSESRHYHVEGNDRWYGGHFQAINMKDDINHPTNLRIDFSYSAWLEENQKHSWLKIESIEIPMANFSPIGTRTTVEMQRNGHIVQSGSYAIETVAWTADSLYERIGHHAIAFDPVLSDMNLSHRDLCKFDMPYILSLIEVFSEKEMLKIGDTKVV